ncbi:hypothetical protein PIB30_037064 [Stylosanthes scabra]|uniref:Uncharacterized protein n=1 Tax=Stylosanthes scabra TaxID=79078 RepID=A0ABU6VD87_9FABA|nr:hypothetical protein [Stylosanthes scabra]
MVNGAWILDGAMDNCVNALSLASRNGWLLIDYVVMCMLEIDENMSMHGFESTPSSRFYKLPGIESIQLATESIRFHPDFKINVQKNREPSSRGPCEANDSVYGNSGPSGVVSAVGSLFPRGTKNPWVGDSHSVYYQTFQIQVQAWKVGEASVELRVSSFLRRSSLPLHVLEN